MSDCVWETWEVVLFPGRIAQKERESLQAFKRSKCRATEIFLKRELELTWHSCNNTAREHRGGSRAPVAQLRMHVKVGNLGRLAMKTHFA